MGRAVALALCLALAAIGCSSAGAGSAADRAMIDRLRRAYAEAYSAGDVERTLGMYSADAVLMPQSQPAMTTPSAVRTYLKQSFDQFRIELLLSSEEIVFVGEGFVYDRGRYSLRAQARAGGSVTEDVGKYLVLWRRQDDGSWKIERDIDNSSNPIHWDRR